MDEKKTRFSAEHFSAIFEMEKVSMVTFFEFSEKLQAIYRSLEKNRHKRILEAIELNASNLTMYEIKFKKKKKE